MNPAGTAQNGMNTSFAYNQTGAMNAITFYLDSGTFTTGSVLLYGVK